MVPAPGQAAANEPRQKVVRRPARVRFRIRTILIAIAVLTPLVYLVVVPLWKYYSLPAKDRAVLAALETRADMPFGEATPFQSLLKHIKLHSVSARMPNGVPIYVDPVGFTESGHTMQDPVRIQSKDERLKTSLQRVLGPMGLAYKVKDGLLVISSKKGLDVDLP